VPEGVCAGYDEEHEYKKWRGDNIKKMALESTEDWVHLFTSFPISTEIL
jgi:hypothetical protein